MAPIHGKSLAGRRGVVSHAGAALLAEAADRLGLTAALSRGLAGMRERRGRHDPGRVVRDLAMMLADGGDCLADLRAVRDQEPLFGAVASDATAWRVIDAIAADAGLLDALRCARARAREHAWNAVAAPERIVVDIDATLIGAYSEKEGAAGTFKGGFGFHPLLGYLDETREALAGVLRPGNAGANTAADLPRGRRACARTTPARADRPARRSRGRRSCCGRWQRGEARECGGQRASATQASSRGSPSWPVAGYHAASGRLRTARTNGLGEIEG